MRGRNRIACLALGAITGMFSLHAAWGAALSRPAIPRGGDLPLSFIENRGQMDPAVLYYARGTSGVTFFTREEIVFDITLQRPAPGKDGMEPDDALPGEMRAVRQVFSLKPVDMDPGAVLKGTRMLKGRVNYFRGEPGSGSFTGIRTFGELLYRNVYRGVDLRFYSHDKRLTYDLILRPGAELSKITMDYEGVEGLSVDGQGDLMVTTQTGVFRQKKPHVYQAIGGKRVPVAGEFELRGEQDGHHRYGFKIGRYDKGRALVIDPSLTYSTYLGGEQADWVRGLGRDADGYIYLAGGTASRKFPRLKGAFQMENAGNFDAFVTKLSPDMKRIEYSTYIGGSDMDYAYRMAVDPEGHAYITGLTKSSDFPLYAPLQGSYGGGDTDAFVVKLSPDGQRLLYSSYLGGSGADWGRSVSVDAAGAAYVVGDTTSTDYHLANPYQAANHGERDVFVTKISPDGRSFVYSTYLGGSNHDWARGTTIDNTGRLYVTGGVWSADFPVVNPIKDHIDGVHDIFIFILSADGQSLLYSTYYGGTNSERGRSIKIGNDDAIYVGGVTWSLDFPVVNAMQSKRGDKGQFGAQDGFVLKLAPDGQTVVFATYLGGFSSDEVNDIAVDADGNVYAVGDTTSYDFPVSGDAYDTTFAGNVEGVYGNTDIYLSKISADGQTLYYSTYLGGSGDDRGYCILLDDARIVYLAGGSASTDFPTTADALDPDCGTDGLCDNDAAGDGILVMFDMRPRVASVSPGSIARNVNTDTIVDIVFDGIMDPATLTESTIRINGLSAAVTFDSGTRTVTLTPSIPFSSSTTYTVTVTTGCKDISGMPLNAEYAWSFTTAPDPDSRIATGETGCFIATAAYGSYLDPHVRTLRDFRDNYLQTHAIGRAFVKYYRGISPPIAASISKHEGLKAVTRTLLAPVVFAVAYPYPSLVLTVGCLLVVAAFRKRRRSRA